MYVSLDSPHGAHTQTHTSMIDALFANCVRYMANSTWTTWPVGHIHTGDMNCSSSLPHELAYDFNYFLACQQRTKIIPLRLLEFIGFRHSNVMANFIDECWPKIVVHWFFFASTLDSDVDFQKKTKLSG